MKDPHVGVSIQELQSHAVSVVGAVKSPGVFQIRGTKTVIEMLSMAQGLTDDAGDTVWVTRGAAMPAAPPNAPSKPGAVVIPPSQATGGETATVNLKNLLESADPAINVPVHPGDIVRVARAGIVYVVGEVQKPGGFVLTNNENISVLQALALAQGLTRTSAKSQARIIRTDPGTGKRTEIPMDLGKILASKAPDPTLQPKDIVFVPNSSAKSALYRGTETVLYSAGEAAVYRW
jgi:polysaccharide export outer membrane protein